jgi:SAM-dependent methyltransferase
MLSAGCGTGQYVLELARRLRPRTVLAVDLSRASLGYAARKAAELKAEIAFAQADILETGKLETQFDFIESSGVLHHMAEPFAGWQALITRLAPGGVMLVALYSRTARRLVAEVRDWIAREGFAASPAGIRACRARLMEYTESELGMIAGAADFFSVSACRDLLFHVQEHGMDLPGIAAFLKENGLTFLGFETGENVLALYRARFPHDPAALDLANWASFEAEHPATFAAMYQFWVQKPE